MNVYEYVAEKNPIVARGIIESFGYEHANTSDMGLSQVVATVGEKALIKVMENHPDKDIILELFAEKKESGCGCGGNCGGKKERFLNIDGGEIAKEKENSSNIIAQQTNVMILVSALFIFTALMIKK